MKAKLLAKPGRVRLAGIAGHAESCGIYAVESEKRGIMYFYNDGEYAIVTASKGTLRMSADEAGTILAELAGIKEDVDDIRRAGRRK